MFNSELTTDSTTQVYSQILYSINIIIEYGLKPKFVFKSIQINSIGLFVNISSYYFITEKSSELKIKSPRARKIKYMYIYIYPDLSCLLHQQCYQ